MAYIYKITNQITGKSYIGKTLKSVNERWKEHCHDYKRQRCEKRPLYNAMNKYGIENFFIEEIEQCQDDEVSNREIYWIRYFNTYHNGYNATKGGDGSKYLDYNLIIKTYNELKNQAEVARQLNISVDSVHNILVANGVTILESKEVSQKAFSKPVAQLDKKTLEVIKIYPSVIAAENELGIQRHIAAVCNGKRKTAGGYSWKYI